MNSTAQYVNATICGVQINGLKLMKSLYSGYDPHHKESFASGTQIAYIHQSGLTKAQIEAIFPDGKAKALAVQWPLKEVATKATTSFDPNKYQLDILNDVIDSEKHLLINALAGSGKTSTLVWVVQELAKRGLTKGKQIIYLAFNASIKEELSIKLQGTGVPAMTTHGFGFKALRKRFGTEINPHNGKMARDAFVRILCNDNGFSLTKEALKNIKNTDEYKLLNSAVFEMVGYVKNWAIVPIASKDGFEFTDVQKQSIAAFIEQYEVEFDRGRFTEEQLVDYVARVVMETIPSPNGPVYEIDYDDMLYFIHVFNLDLGKYDMVLTDESQDFNYSQKLLLDKLIRD